MLFEDTPTADREPYHIRAHDIYAQSLAV